MTTGSARLPHTCWATSPSQPAPPHETEVHEPGPECAGAKITGSNPQCDQALGEAMLARIYNAVGAESFTRGLRELFEAQTKRTHPDGFKALQSAFDHEGEIIEAQLAKYAQRP